ncbi:VOC family protein, partial [Acidobacteria bacterium AH-259-D05]|nr:VOC family protein [Acidobacteria bacterium AH-259-D05]
LKVGFLLIVLSITAQCSPPPEDQTNTAHPIVRQIDHVIVGVEDPTPLFTWFTETMGLPVAWSLATFGDFESGGVSFGNMHLEVLHTAPELAASQPGDGRFLGVAFEPTPLDDALRVLQSRGIPVSTPSASDTYPLDPWDTVRWTTVDLLSLARPDTWVFLCEYAEPNIREIRGILEGELRQREGGGIGIVGAQEIVLGADADPNYIAAWNEFLAPTGFDDDLIADLGSGPRIRIEPDMPKGLHRLIIRVRSLTEARRYLESLGIVTENGEANLRILPEHAFGLDIRLVGA